MIEQHQEDGQGAEALDVSAKVLGFGCEWGGHRAFGAESRPILGHPARNRRYIGDGGPRGLRPHSPVTEYLETEVWLLGSTEAKVPRPDTVDP